MAKTKYSIDVLYKMIFLNQRTDLSRSGEDFWWLHIWLLSDMITPSPNTSDVYEHLDGVVYQEVRRNADEWGFDGLAEITNNKTIEFPEYSGSAKTITHFAVCDQEHDKVIYYGELDSSLELTSGVIPKFEPGALKIVEG